MRDEVITMAHGSGGASSADLMRRVFSKHFNGEILARLEDSAVIDAAGGRLAVSTDSFVVSPLFFPGGDIGKLAVCGTVNDVLMSGAEPRWLTCGFIIETGLPIDELDSVCASLARTAEEAGVTIIAGDTKVIEGRGEGGGLMINTTGIGIIEQKGGSGDAVCVTSPNYDESEASNDAGNDAGHEEGAEAGRDAGNDTVNDTVNDAGQGLYPAPSGIRPGDTVIVTGNLGDHHAAILTARMGIENSIQSDCAILTPIIEALREAGVNVHAMRDVTRGGLATVLNELADASGVSIELEEESIPVGPEVKAFCGIMGLDPLYMGNEGKVALAVAPEDAERALAAIRGTEIGRDAAVIGAVVAARPVAVSLGATHAGTLSVDIEGITTGGAPALTMRTRIGGTVRLDMLYGEGLPRIC